MSEEQQVGLRALTDGVCGYAGCDDPVLKDQRVVKHKDGWMHVHHASGWDDGEGGHTKKPARKRAAKKSAGGQAPDVVRSVGSEPEVGAVPPADPPPDWTVTAPGLIEGMPNDVYHADPWPGGSVSNSDAKLLLEAPALYAYKRAHGGGKSSSAMNLGSAAHTRVLGEGDRLVKIDAAEYRTNDAKAARDRALRTGGIPLLGVRKYPDRLTEWEVVDAMANALERDPLAPYLFAAGRAEVSAFWVDPETQVPRRARFDFLPDTVEGKTLIVPDYKTKSGSLSPESFARHALDFGYTMQDHTYRSALAALGIDVNAGFLFVVQSPDPPYMVAVHQLTDEAREHGHSRTLRALNRWRDCTESGVWWGWSGKIHTVDLPGWAYSVERAAAEQEKDR